MFAPSLSGIHEKRGQFPFFTGAIGFKLGRVTFNADVMSARVSAVQYG